MRIALDVMGGDHGCGPLIGGASQALASLSGLKELHLVGDEKQIKDLLRSRGISDSRLRILHASEVLTMQDKPLEAVRKKKDSSMVRAVELVRDGKADAIISQGNTGALVASATFRLKRLEGVDRPAIMAVFPGLSHECVFMDVGANHECKPEHLVQFAVMGAVYSRSILGRDNPRVGVLCNGTEESKGNELTQETVQLLRKTHLNCVGYVEGFDLFNDTVEVVVADGFVGNIVLKTCEGMARTVGHLLKKELFANAIRRAGAFFAQGALKKLKRRMNPDAYGGAPILGLKGNVIKAHGSAREEAIFNAIRVASESVRHNINRGIEEEMIRVREAIAPREAAAVTQA